MSTWHVAGGAHVRARIAALSLGAPLVPRELGTITLREHQRDAAGRLRHALLRFGGALLADDVGLGKTYTAIAAAGGLGRILVVAPASLATMWRQALGAARTAASFVSFEALSRAESTRFARRGGAQWSTSHPWDVVIIDEAHHARNPRTRRYGRIATLTARARVLLLSATPVHNAADDLHALLALFLGDRARNVAPSDLGACIVRRTHADVPTAGTPARAPPIWLAARPDPEVLEALLAIAPPCPPRGGGGANALVTLGLVRAWSSTDAALRSLLRRRLARAESLADALRAGRHPTAAELRAWAVGDDATQLAFPELVTWDSSGVDASGLLRAVHAHAAGLRSALGVLGATGGRADESRRDLLRCIRARHADRPIVVFSQYTTSVHTMFRHLVQDGGVCALTARGAIVAGGPLSRREALARFAPRALGVRSPPRSEAIAMLIATDLLSEGLNLQDAAVVVHLDLPWTPARLAQRMGRVWRIGSRHADVFEYAVAPPPPAERTSSAIARLLRKSAVARGMMGHDSTPILTPPAPTSSSLLDPGCDVGAERLELPGDVPRAAEAVRQLLARWADEFRAAHHEADPSGVALGGERETIVAAVRASVDGWLAAVIIGAEPSLVERRAGCNATTDPVRILALARDAGGDGCDATPRRVALALGEIQEFARSKTAARDAGLSFAASPAHTRVSARISEIVATCPPHRRPAISRLAAAARTAISRVRGAGVERSLWHLVASADDPVTSGNGHEPWLRQLAAFGQSSPAASGDGGLADCPVVPAVLLLVATRE